MTTFVLVPGFWLGGWAWRPVTDTLRAHGHDVYPLSLTGLGERAHLARTDTDLDTHVTDVLNLLTYEDLHDVVLVGHSYAGSVVTVAADRMPERVSRLVYVDTGPLPDGATQQDFAADQAATPDADGLLPPPDWAALAADVSTVDDAAVARLTALSVGHPAATATTPIRLTGAWEPLPRLGILSSFTADQVRAMAENVPLMRHMAGERWQYEELPTWHWPMISRPADLARILHERTR